MLYNYEGGNTIEVILMPFQDVTNIILTEEKAEMDEILRTNPKARKAYAEFEAECKLRRELADARKNQNITQSELKERSGLTQQAISRIETDHEISPSTKNLIKYVNAIGYELTLQPKNPAMSMAER